MQNSSDRGVSLAAAISIVVASMIGVGVFTSVGFQLESIPSAFPILLLWLLGGIVSYCGALCYAELISLAPGSGGEYHLIRETIHPLPAFLAGWISIVAGFSATIAAVAMAFAGYLRVLGFNTLHPTLIAAGVILAIAAIHIGRLEIVSRFLTATTFLKIALILAFIVAAIVFSSPVANTLAPAEGDAKYLATTGFATSFVYVMFAYSGWNGASYIAGEVRNPQRTVPLSFGIGVALVTVLYVCLNAAFLARSSWDELSGKLEAALFAGQSIFGPVGGRVMAGLIAFGALSTIAAYTWGGSRVAARMGQDFPRLAILSRTNRFGAPIVALLIQTALALAMLFSGSFDQVVNYLMNLLVLSSLLTVIGVPVMRHRKPNGFRAFRVPLYPLPIIIYVAAALWMIVCQWRDRPRESSLGLATVVAGVVVYFRVRE
jgi:APA family basic amino acid/polyamine antiporter